MRAFGNAHGMRPTKASGLRRMGMSGQPDQPPAPFVCAQRKGDYG